MKKVIILLIIICMFGGLGYLGNYQYQKKINTVAAESIDDQQLKTGVPVRIYDVVLRDLEKSVSISGSIEALKTVQITPKVSDYIEKIHVTTGQKVKKGDLLVSLDATNNKLQLAQAKVTLTQAEQNLIKLQNGARPEEIEGAQMRLDQATALYELQKIELERQNNLYAEGATTEQAWQNAQNQTNSQRSAVGAARAQLELLKAGTRAEDIELARIQVQLAQVAVDQAQQNLDDHFLYAPTDGRVTLRLIEEGDMSEFNKTIFQIVQLDQVYLVLEVSELYLPKISEDLEIAVRIDPLGDQQFTGVIKEINPIATPQNRSYTTKLLIDNSQDQLKPGMYGRGEIILKKVQQTPAIPTGAVYIDGDQAYVLIVDENLTAQRKNITVEESFGEYVYATGEIAIGQQIISFTQDIVDSGTLVKIDEETGVIN
ncbi:MAG: efflux RND transporter periplasmic adaptor subunit [Planctomycetes bacterium]|nr:efflux RND transporter periplasmic adaptor subunit [Planctomycetota bacterium]